MVMSKLKTLRTYVIWIAGLAALYFLLLLLFAGFPRLVNYIPNVKTTTGGYGHSLIRFAEADGLDEVDVMFLGSSHTYRSFDPRVFAEYGMKTFNLGSTQQTPLNTYYLLERYVDRVEVDLYVLDTYWGVSAVKGVESTIDLASNMAISEEHFKMAFATRDWTAINSVLSDYVSQKLRGDEFLDPQKQREIALNTYVPGGYVESRATVDLSAEAAQPKTATVELNEKQLRYVEKIVQLVHEAGAEIMFVRVPVSPELYEAIANYSESVLPYEQIAAKYSLDFVDFNEPPHRERLALDLQTHFYDSGHMNSQGVSIFGRYIAPILSEELSQARRESAD